MLRIPEDLSHPDQSLCVTIMLAQVNVSFLEEKPSFLLVATFDYASNTRRYS